ncbi:hypothetical protein [Clostridium argentinense]|nr:hypothetical protein [Clostridium argentinense]
MRYIKTVIKIKQQLDPKCSTLTMWYIKVRIDEANNSIQEVLH